VPFDTANAPYWFLNPKFSSFVVQQKANAVIKDADKNIKSVQDHLAACQTQEEVYDVVKRKSSSDFQRLLTYMLPALNVFVYS
jgi:hypothetical protein